MCMSLEAAVDILEKPTLQCCSFLLYYSLCIAFWNNILELGLKKVLDTFSMIFVKLNRTFSIFRFSISWIVYTIICRETEQDLFNVMGALYAAVLFLGVNNASSVQPVVAVERSVYYRERAAGMYAALPYAMAQV